MYGSTLIITRFQDTLKLMNRGRGDDNDDGDGGWRQQKKTQ